MGFRIPALGFLGFPKGFGSCVHSGLFYFASPRLKSVFSVVVNSFRLCHGYTPFALPNQHDFVLVAIGNEAFSLATPGKHAHCVDELDLQPALH